MHSLICKRWASLLLFCYEPIIGKFTPHATGISICSAPLGDWKKRLDSKRALKSSGLERIIASTALPTLWLFHVS